MNDETVTHEEEEMKRLQEYFVGRWSFTRNIMCAKTKRFVGKIDNGKAEFSPYEGESKKMLYT